MKNLLLTCLLLCLSSSLFGQTSNTNYSRVKINLLKTELSEITQLGLETDHGELAKGRHFINDFSEREMALLKEHNIDFEVLIDNVKAHYRAQNEHFHDHDHDHHHQHPVVKNPGPCEETENGISYDYTTPENYTYGSMGGYLTYAELLVVLDNMRSLYPHLISAKTPVEDVLTHGERPIYWLRVSNNPDVEEEEPEVLFTALHHAREPNSLSQMIFYLWYLLENYDTDPEVKYLVDNTQQYFMPCLNPDGYIYNEQTDPNGGGLWRKNRWVDENGDTLGVDLNRNYGYEWGIDDQGSSPNPQSQVYRGTEGFSEPETQAVRDFCNLHQFQICLNYHAYGNLLIYPWGYSDTPTEETESFLGFSQLMAAENDFFAGTGTETVGYTVNGDSDDWMYGEMDSKPRIFALTPEVGENSFGFWPPQNQIDRLNKSCLRQNLVTAHLVLNYAELEDNNAVSVFAQSGLLDFDFKKFGLADGAITITMASASPELTVDSSPQTFVLSHLEKETFTVNYQVDSEIPVELLFEATLNNGDYSWTQTFSKQYFPGAFETVFTENASTTDQWAANTTWATTSEAFVSEPSSWTDSPNGNYERDAEAVLRMESPIDLTNATAALARFHARWSIEANYDYAQFMISTDGVNFEAQCGQFTRIGNDDQDEGQPLYDGEQGEWVIEEIDLSAYLGQQIYLQYRIVSDGFVERDGFYFDDLVIEVVLDTNSATHNVDMVQQLDVFPNPFQNTLTVDCLLNEATASLELSVYTGLGQLVEVQKRNNLVAARHQWELNTSEWQAGLYLIQLRTAEGGLVSRKMTKF